MNITPTDRLLTLLSHALETTLIPELTSSNTRAIAGIMQAVLDELLKRESRTQDLVRACIVEGRQLETELNTLLAEASATPGREQARSCNAADLVGASLLATAINEHAALTGELARVTQALSAARTRPGLADRQTAISDLLLRAANWELRYYTEQHRPLPVPETSTRARSAPLTAETLTAFVQSRHPDGAAVRISGFESIPGGFGKQTSSFTLHDASGNEQKLIARKNDPQPMLRHGGFHIENEFHLVRAVAATGYPAPKPLWLGTDVAGVDASFYIMQRMPGRVPGSFLGGMDGGDMEAMLLDVAAQLGRLHAYPIEVFADYIREHDDPALLTDTVESCCRRHLADWRRYAAETALLSSPFLHYLLDWLEHHVPADPRPPVLLHGDFNIHNLLVENDRVSGVLDWECAMFGAPEHELAYIQPHISQHIAWDRFVARYRESGGRELEPANMAFWLAFSSLRMQIAMLSATRNLQTAVNDDIRYAMVELGFGPRFMELAMAGTQSHQ